MSQNKVTHNRECAANYNIALIIIILRLYKDITTLQGHFICEDKKTFKRLFPQYVIADIWIHA